MRAGHAIEVSRVLPAPVDEVFRWWTEPELVERWMTPTGSVEAEIDLRVGGSFRIVMKDAGVVLEHTGQYLEIDRPRRLVFSWRSQFTGGDSLVMVSCQPHGATETRLLIVHSELPEPAGESHRSGWGTMTDRLAGELVTA